MADPTTIRRRPTPPTRRASRADADVRRLHARARRRAARRGRSCRGATSAGAASSASSPATCSRARRRSSGPPRSCSARPPRLPARILDPDMFGRPPRRATATAPPPAPTGFRTPFREERRHAVHRRPAQPAGRRSRSTTAKSAAEVAYAIREMIVRGAPAIGQVAAIGLALTATKLIDYPAVRAAGDDAWRGQRPAQLAPDGGQPGLGGRSHHGRVRGGRRPVRGRRRDRRRASGRRPTPSSSRRPRTTAGWPASGSRSCRRPADRARPGPDPLQHRPARLRPVRDRPRGRPGRAPRGAADPRLGRRDAAVPAGRPADGLGAGPGRRRRTRSSRTSRPGT